MMYRPETCVNGVVHLQSIEHFHQDRTTKMIVLSSLHPPAHISQRIICAHSKCRQSLEQVEQELLLHLPRGLVALL